MLGPVYHTELFLPTHWLYLQILSQLLAGTELTVAQETFELAILCRRPKSAWDYRPGLYQCLSSSILLEIESYL